MIDRYKTIRFFALPLLLLMGTVLAGVAQAQTLDLPKIRIPEAQSFAPDAKPAPPVLADAHSVNLHALLVDGEAPIEEGLHWRIFGAVEDENGRLPLVAELQGGSAGFVLSEGRYFAHVAFGHAGATRKFTVKDSDFDETLVLNAGGLVLNAALPEESPLNAAALHFSIYEVDEDATGNRPLVAAKVTPGAIVRLKAGTYHVVSEYGEVNAKIRGDVIVEAGRITEATMEHRAATLLFKLARIEGGQAIPGTQWSLYNESGDLLAREVGPYASLILAEGDYSVVAQNRERTFERSFNVQAGMDQEVEILISDTQ